MYFKYNNTSSYQLEAVLAKEDVTLKEVMEEVDIINECKVQNKALIEYLVKPEILEELVTLTITEPNSDENERTRYKYSNIACEMITCDIPLLNERLAGNEKLLEKLYQFLDCGDEHELNPLLASFFSKIMCVLIAKKNEQNWFSYQFTCLQVLDFLKAKENFVALLLRHQGTSAIMDLTLKLMTQVEGVEIRQNILNYLDSQRIIQSLISLLDGTVDKARHHNVAQLLCDFIQTARNNTERNEPDPLLNTLESPETVELLLNHMLNGDEKSETAIVGGIQVLLELLNVKNCIPKYDISSGANPTKYEDTVNDMEVRSRASESITKVIIKRLKDFHDLLINPPKKEPIITTIGTLNPPLGNTRLQVTKLLAALINIGGNDVAQELISLGTMELLIDLFFAFPWNNFLHTQVEACIAAAMLTSPTPAAEQGDNIALSKHLLVNCKLVERILKAWKENDDLQKQENGIRQGYMGHLISIVNNIVILCSDGPLSIVLQDNMPEVADTLKTFKETTLDETIKQQEKLLGGVNPDTYVEEDEYGVILELPSTGLGQQNFNEFQIQAMVPNFHDSYGHNDDDFKEGDEVVQNIDHRTGMNFDLSERDYVQQYELFKQVCAQNINTLEDSDDQIFSGGGGAGGGGDDDDGREQQSMQTVIEKGTIERNSSSDEEDFTEPWFASSDPQRIGGANVIMAEDPWASHTSVDITSTEQTNLDRCSAVSGVGVGGGGFENWANFEANFDAFNTATNTSSTTTMPPPTNADEAPVCIENDLKVENIEIIDSKDADMNLNEDNKDNDIIAQDGGDGVDQTAIVVNKSDDLNENQKLTDEILNNETQQTTTDVEILQQQQQSNEVAAVDEAKQQNA